MPAQPSRNQCTCCGQKGKRDCPALGSRICSSCCATKRGSEIQCTAECVHFPFSAQNYSKWIELDGSWSPKVFKFITKHLSKEQFLANLNQMCSGLVGESEKAEMLPCAILYILIHKRTPQGETFGELMQRECAAEFTHDEKVMTHYGLKSFATILEIQKILDGQSTLCVDLLEPESKPFIVIDRNFTKNAFPYARLLVWITHYPHYTRMNGAGFPISNFVEKPFHSWLAEVFDDEFKKRPGITTKQFVSENFGECGGTILNLGEEMTQQLVKTADLHQCVAHYRIVGNRGDVQKVLADKPEFIREDHSPDDSEADPDGTDHYVWLRKGESKKIEESMPEEFRHDDESEGVGVLGSLKLGADRMIVQTFSNQKQTFAMEMVEHYFGNLLALEGEGKVDVAKQVHAARERGDQNDLPKPKKEIPPELEAQLVQKMMSDHYRKFLDSKVPALGGLTPREASKLPGKRLELVKLMKSHIQSVNQMCVGRPFKIDINEALDALGLLELKGS